MLAARPTVTEAAASISVTDQEVDDTDRSGGDPFVFNGVDIGAADTGRYVLVAVTVRGDAGLSSLGDVTINGTPAVTLATSTSNGVHTTAIYGVRVPDGANADVEVTLPEFAYWCRIAVARAVGIVLTPIDTASDFETGDPIGGNTTLDLDVDVVSGGVVFGFIGMSNIGSPSSDWSDLTDAAAQPAGEGRGGSAAFLAASATESPRDISVLVNVSLGSSFRPTAVVASFTEARLALVRPPNNLGLIGYWSFNEGTGTVAGDFSGNGHHGTINGATWTSGKLGTALNFDGDDDQVDIPLSSLSSYTVSMWVYIDALGAGAGNSYNTLISNDVPDSGLFFRGTAAGANAGKIDTLCDGGTDGRTTASLALRTWNHVVLTNNAGTGTFYLNGTGNGAVTITCSVSFASLGNDSADENFDGRLDEVRVYNRALSPSEVAKLYQSGAVRINASSADLDNGSSLERGLVGHWTFDGGDAQSTIKDRSSNAFNGFFIGGATSSAKVAGKLGQALSFDGTDDYVNIGNKTLVDGATAMSVCAWMKYTPTSVTADGTIAGEFINSDGPWMLYVDDDAIVSGRSNTVTFVINTSAARVEGSTNLVTTGVWDHYCGTYQGSSFLRLYKNGVLDQENTTSISANITTSSQPIRLGAAGDNARFLNAKLDDVRVYNRALSPDEVRQLYKLGTVRITR
jgi:hypothetical protein